MPHIFDVLHEDHERVAQLLQQIEKTNDDDVDERASLLEIVRDELELHAKFEEVEVYPAIEKALGKPQKLHHAVDEHVQAMQILSSADETAATNGKWREQIKQLKSAIEHHVEEEENEVFPAARPKLSAADAESMASEYQARKESASL